MKPSIVILIAACLCASRGGILGAAVAPLPPEDLESRASDILVGKLIDLDVKQEPAELHGILEREFRQLGYMDLALYYTLEVTASEKGEGVQPGDQIVVRAYCWRERNRSYPESQGHYPLPAVGQEVRVYLNGRSVVFPNGFAPPQQVAEMENREFFSEQAGLDQSERLESFRVDEVKPAIESISKWPVLVVVAIVVATIGVVMAAYRRSSRQRP